MSSSVILSSFVLLNFLVTVKAAPHGLVYFRPDLGPNTLKSIQIHYNYFDLSMITIT